jgi:hypothetical protein
MTPVAEPTVLTGDGYTLRHVGPGADVWPNTPGSQYTLLQRNDMVARPLPSSPLPTSPDLVTGSWTGRLGDSGEATLTFPNKIASDGIAWRDRFDPTGHLQFVEIYYNNELDYVGVIDQIPTIDQTQVQIHLADGWWMLKKAYVRDWIVTQSPRDVIERGTGLWMPVVADDFPAGSTLSSQWTVSGTGTATIAPGGGCLLTPGGAYDVLITSNLINIDATSTWRFMVTMPTWVPNGDANSYLLITASAGSGTFANLNFSLASGASELSNSSGTYIGSTPSSVSAGQSVTLMLECDGEWLWGFVNGQLVACIRTSFTGETSLQAQVTAVNEPLTVGQVILTAWQPFLQAGADKGDYVLPGDETTYPYGGLTARYFNDSDLAPQTLADLLTLVLAPSRTQAYLGSGAPEYMNQTDPQIDGQSPPGFAATSPGPGGGALPYWTCRWFGAVYLKLSEGNYTFSVTIPSSSLGFRLWVGATRFGQQLFDAWTLPLGGTNSATLTASSLAGTLPYGGGTVARDGWYPIILEYGAFSTAIAAPTLSFTPPVSYTDPGGTALTGGSSVAIPSTSLSPLGCVDQRYQGIAHYDLVQQTVQAYGYQASVEPHQLESGLFPGVLAPRVREGHDTDIVLQPDRGPRQDGENILNYSSGLDATDFADSLWGNGAGLQNGNQGQMQGNVVDVPTMLGSLFDVQQWIDFSDASSPQLLQALLNSQLGLQLSPWQLLSADPNGRPRNSYTWPLPGSIAKMRWRPGDGLLIRAADINVWDTSPRQMLTFTRNLLPLGISSSNASFAERPKTQARILKQQLYKATRWARAYQRQLVQLTSLYTESVLTAGAQGGGSTVSLLPSDSVVQAWVRINANTAGQPLNLYINGVLFNTYTQVPVSVNIMSVAVPNNPYGRLLAYIVNSGGSTTTVDYQILLTVLR